MSMPQFRYAQAHALRDALEALSPDTLALAGGTDLVNLIKEGLQAPQALVSLRGIPELSGIARQDDALRIGAATTLTDLVRSDEIAGDGWGALREALYATASPQLRHMATLGGNLLQAPRCWYYRDAETPCWRKGGRMCYAFRGENRGHVIFGGGPCFAVHPSDPAVALAAMDAQVEIVGAEGRRRIALDAFFRKPDREHRIDNALRDNEIIAAILVPDPEPATASGYVKVADRATWDFALASVAATVQLSERSVAQCRLYLGGVAFKPWRAEAAEEALLGHPLDEASIAAAAQAAVEGAGPLEHNGYKVDLVRGVVKQLLTRLAQR